MAILKIKNFGPISENKDKEGHLINDGFFEVNILPVTIFIGPQASGKSTVAKLYSTFAWLEKALVQGKEKYEHFNGKNSFIEYASYLKYHGVYHYSHDNTDIEYYGDSYIFRLKENKLFVSKKGNNDNYFCPKIMYIPAERNLLTVNETESDRMTNLLGSFKTFISRYSLAKKKSFKDGEIFNLPISNLKAKYNEFLNTIKIINSDSTETDISVSSSGTQSVVPMFVVSKYLSKRFKEFNLKEAIDTSSPIVIDNYYKSGKENIFNHYFINIVEEPEQNLFPDTQAEVLYELLKCKNANHKNKLIISTHSPYILMALNSAILAKEVFEKTRKTLDTMPPDKMTSYKDVSAYKFENEKIIPIMDDKYQMVDSSKIDDCSINTAELNSQLRGLMYDK